MKIAGVFMDVHSYGKKNGPKKAVSDLDDVFPHDLSEPSIPRLQRTPTLEKGHKKPRHRRRRRFKLGQVGARKDMEAWQINF